MVLLVKAFMRLYVAFTPSEIFVMLAGKGRIVMEDLRELSLEGSPSPQGVQVICKECNSPSGNPMVTRKRPFDWFKL